MNKLDLSQIQAPVFEELKVFSKTFKKYLKSDIRLVEFAIRFILSQKGKKIRPLLVLLSAKISGGVEDRSFRGASLVELLHTATLIHDDVVDKASKRRGLPSLNKIWGNKISVLVGDFLLSKGLMISVENNDFDFLKTITNTVKKMSEGELLQIYKAKKLDIDEETYFKIISYKTASLIATCCEIGARSTTNDPEKIDALRNYGEFIGIAFQIQDDILDFIGKTKIFGKIQGVDLKEKKITLPLIYALNNSNKVDSKTIIRTIQKGVKEDEIEKIISFVVSNGGIDYSKNVAGQFTQKAKDSLDIFEESESKAALIKLVDFVVNREL